MTTTLTLTTIKGEWKKRGVANTLFLHKYLPSLTPCYVGSVAENHLGQPRRMSAEVAASIKNTRERNMQPDDAGGGSRDDTKFLKRKSSEKMETILIGGKKSKKLCKRRKNKKKQLQKKTKNIIMDENARDCPAGTSSRNSTKIGKRKRRGTGTFNAPFNSTQFLMSDHPSEAVKHLNSTLNVKQKASEAVVEANGEESNSLDSSLLERPVRRITRARESSFSIDSDEDYYYSSPEDEEDFLNREFIKDYDNVRNDRLVDMSKAELINEYLQMEQKIETLEQSLSSSHKALNKSTGDLADTIQKFQIEIRRLESENDKLKKTYNKSSSGSSCSSCSDSSSDSNSSESSSDSSSDSEDDDQITFNNAINISKIDTVVRKMLREDAQDDTGYESGNSHKQNTGAKNNDTLETEVESKPKLNTSISDNCITSTSL